MNEEATIEETKKPRKGRVGRPRGPKEKRPVGRPKGSKNKDHRGGKREGAGRKAYLAPEEKKVNLTLVVSPKVRELCDVLRDNGLNLSQIFCQRVKQLATSFTGEEYGDDE